jgi:hypothetical protein
MGRLMPEYDGVSMLAFSYHTAFNLALRTDHHTHYANIVTRLSNIPSSATIHDH